MDADVREALKRRVRWQYDNPMYEGVVKLHSEGFRINSTFQLGLEEMVILLALEASKKGEG